MKKLVRNLDVAHKMMYCCPRLTMNVLVEAWFPLDEN